MYLFKYSFACIAITLISLESSGQTIQLKNSTRTISVNDSLQKVPKGKYWKIDKLIKQTCKPSDHMNTDLEDRYSNRMIIILIDGEKLPFYNAGDRKLVVLHNPEDWELSQQLLDEDETVHTECKGDIISIKEYKKNQQ